MVFERLAEHFEHGLPELGKLVEEQHAPVRQADLARTRQSVRRLPGPRMKSCDAAHETAVSRTSGCPEGNMPATEKILETSMASSRPSGGKIDGNDLANRVLPVPGGPVTSTLCPPAAAISRPRLTCSWPRTAERSVA